MEKPTTHKRCTNCYQILPFSAFYKRAASKDLLSYKCKECTRISHKETYQKHRTKILTKNRLYYESHKPQMQEAHKRWEAQRRANGLPIRSKRSIRNKLLKHNYGITVVQFEAMLNSQGNACLICKRGEPVVWHVDHEHRTKQVRGILCPRCNIFLGMLETPELLDKALRYLAK